MVTETESDSLLGWVAVVLVITPIVAGGLLFVLFESGPIHDLGLFLIGAGVIVGAALFLLRMEILWPTQ